MNIYGPDVEHSCALTTRSQCWIHTDDEMNATMELVGLGLAACHNGIFYRTWKGEREIERLYNR